MFVLPKGTLVHFGGMPFELLEDTPTNGSEVNYKIGLHMNIRWSTRNGAPTEPEETEPERRMQEAVNMRRATILAEVSQRRATSAKDRGFLGRLKKTLRAWKSKAYGRFPLRWF